MKKSAAIPSNNQPMSGCVGRIILYVMGAISSRVLGQFLTANVMQPMIVRSKCARESLVDIATMVIVMAAGNMAYRADICVRMAGNSTQGMASVMRKCGSRRRKCTAAKAALMKTAVKNKPPMNWRRSTSTGVGESGVCNVPTGE